MTQHFRIVALTPPGCPDPSIAIAAARCGRIGVYNAEIDPGPERLRSDLARLADKAGGPFGVKLSSPHGPGFDIARDFIPRGLRWLILDAEPVLNDPRAIAAATASGCEIILETTEWDDRLATLSGHDGLIVKGHEAGGRVGEDSTFVLLQKALSRQSRPVYARGGIGLHGAAAARAGGAAGVVLDNQLLLLRESPVRKRAAAILRNFSGLETGVIGNGRGRGWRVLENVSDAHVKALRAEAAALSEAEVAAAVLARLGWDDAAAGFVPLGQDAVFAEAFARRYRSVAGLARAIESETGARLELAAAENVLGEGHGVAAAHGTRYPIVQGPMTRVSDDAGFAQAVAEGGALPMLALAVMKPDDVEALLKDVSARLGDRPWGVGLLGFAPSDLLAEQVAVARRYNPSFALIAGGRPEQTRRMEADGIAGYLHVPTPRLLAMFLEQGSRRFVFEGRECGGHIGPLTSFVLWDRMVDALAEHIGGGVDAETVQVLFAGGIHDARSAAMVAALAAPLAARGVKVGVLMGTAYLFTKEIVDTGAVVAGFQEAALACRETVSLETGPGHASRCSLTPFAAQFFERKRALQSEGKSGDAIREALEALSLGRLRVATKAKERAGRGETLRNVSPERQARDGMYMIGQAATLVDRATTVADLHAEIGRGAQEFLEARLSDALPAAAKPAARPADVAVIGIGALFPKAGNVREYWDNLLDGVDAIGEIPRHRWDWRLYFDEDRSAPDKIYSKWGGFLDDVVFDPMRYGVPPNAIKSVDPMQLITLEVCRQCLDDAGYLDRPFDHERASVILGASGGAGDVGAQYAVRAETARFTGQLDADMASRLPAWTEDSFAGILLNVAAGRAANRFDFGGVNYAIDAACASSLAAVYQGVAELEAGRSDMVVVGGVDTVLGPFGYLCFSKTQALSPRGRCDTFSEEADGIVISEGIAMLALKRLADAERDGDRIYAVIKGVGGSSDGRAKSMTAPHPDGQIRALHRAYEMAGYAPSSVGLFEAHGTGTVAGDSAELETVTRLLAASGASPHQSAIGSVKTLIGHTKATAGVAGLIKAVLACHHKVLPPHGRIATPNRKLTEADSPLYLVDQARPWLSEGATPRRAGVSSFGFGGTNFHVTLEEYDEDFLPAPDEAARHRWPCELLVWRADDRDGLARAVRKAAERLAAAGIQPELRDLAFTLAQQLPKSGRTAALVVNRGDPPARPVAMLADHLENPERPLPPGAFYSAEPLLANGGKLAVLFPGQGAQYPDMLREVALLFPELRKCVERADRILSARMAENGAEGGRLSGFIYPAGIYTDDDRAAAGKRLMRTNVAQPALGAVEAGLWRVLERLGVRADMAAGHSYGEYVALHAAGAFDLDSLIEVSEARGRFMIEAAHGADLGTMAAVQGERATVEAAIAGRRDLCISNHNAPNETTVSGPREAVEAVVGELEAKGVKARMLHVGAAFHSPLVAPAAERLAEFIGSLKFGVAAIPVYSNSSAEAYPTEPEAARALLVEQLTSPVEFVAEITAMYEAGARVFVSVGPRGVHANMVRQVLADRPHRAIAGDDEQGGLRALLQTLGALLCEGARLDVGELFAGRDCLSIDLDDLTASARLPVPAPHMWLLNGSGARRAADPPPAPLTLEEVQERQRNRRIDRPAVADVAGNGATAPARPAPATGQRQDDGIETMDDHRETRVAGEQDSPAEAVAPDYVLPGDRESILAEYQATMRQFLQMQENVMMAYLGQAGTAPAWRPTQLMRAPRPAVRALPSRARPATPAAPRTTNGSGTATAAPAQGNGAGAPATVARPPDRPPGPAMEPPADRANGANGQDGPPTAAPGSDGNGATPLTQAATSDLLLGLVEERTGYPKDMLGMDQNLEADLGIDSIKRVEIVGALLKSLPDGVKAKLGDVGEALVGQKTMQGIVDCLWQRLDGAQEGAHNPFEMTGTGNRPDAACATLSRFVMTAQAQPVAATAPARLPDGLYLITDDGLGVAAALADRIAESGARARILDPDSFEANGPEEKIAGIVHLAPLASVPRRTDTGLDAWRAEIVRNEQSVYRLIQRYADDLRAGGRIVLASGLGGHFARRGGPADGLTVQGGGSGLAKSLNVEWPDCVAKAVDLDPAADASANAGHLFGELSEPGGSAEVGYPGGTRTVFGTAPAALDAGAAPRFTPGPDWVVLATGGARGITAELLRALAPAGLTLVLVGRTPLPEEEEAATRGLATAAEIKQRLVETARASGAAVKPVDIETRLRAILRDREIRANLRDLAEAGAKVGYRVADMADGRSVAALLDDLYRKHGRLDGIVHGAGVIEDRLLVDKSPESWRRVVGTKVDGALALAANLRPEGIKFVVFLTSVAGRYGNSGQTDYAAANELLNRLAWQLQRLWRDQVKVASINWGPWQAPRHGAGMVSEETRRKFEARGVHLVAPEAGAAMFLDEILRAPMDQVEVIAGDGPWGREAAEARAPAQSNEDKAEAVLPLLAGATVEAGAKRRTVLRRRLDAADDVFLDHHRIGGTPVLPAAIALEMMAEAAARLWPDWQVTEVTDLRVLGGLRLENDRGREIEVVVSGPEHAGPDGFSASVELRSARRSGRLHYRSVVRLAHEIPDGAALDWQLAPAAAPLTAHEAYRELLFHGPCFQVIRKLIGFDDTGVIAEVAPTTTEDLTGAAAAGAGWIFDPGVVDAALQIPWLWSSRLRSEAALCHRLGRARRFGRAPLTRGRLLFAAEPASGPQQVRGKVAYVDGGGTVRLLIDELECTASPDLNRMCGYAGEIRV